MLSVLPAGFRQAAATLAAGGEIKLIARHFFPTERGKGEGDGKEGEEGGKKGRIYRL